MAQIKLDGIDETYWNRPEFAKMHVMSPLRTARYAMVYALGVGLGIHLDDEAFSVQPTYIEARTTDDLTPAALMKLARAKIIKGGRAYVLDTVSPTLTQEPYEDRERAVLELRFKLA